MSERPIYESQDDLARERSALDIVSERWGCKARKLPKMYSADALIYDKNRVPRAWAEVKNRTFRSGTFPTYHISVKKVASLCELSRVTKIPAVLIVKLTDVVLWHELRPPYLVVIGGRQDRGDDQDIEPVCEIPFDKFGKVVDL